MIRWALVLCAVAAGAGGCGGASNEAPATSRERGASTAKVRENDVPARTRRLSLSTGFKKRARQAGFQVGPTRPVRTACRRVSRSSPIPVVCPPVVPSGRTVQPDVGGLPKDFSEGWLMSFVSRSIGSRRQYPGHWMVVSGTATAVNTLLRPPETEKPKSRAARVGKQKVRLFTLPGHATFRSMIGGHTVVQWRRRDDPAMFIQVSAHGKKVGPNTRSNQRFVLLLAAAIMAAYPGA